MSGDAFDVNGKNEPTYAQIRNKYGAHPASLEVLAKVMDHVAVVLKRDRANVQTLKTRIEKLKSRPLQKWAGTLIEGTQYSEANLVTHKGSLWCATSTTAETPGEGATAWRVIVKRGDAR